MKEIDKDQNQHQIETKIQLKSQPHTYQIRGWLHFYSEESRIDLVQAKLGQCKVEFFDANRGKPIDRWIVDDTNLLMGGEEKFFLFIGTETTIHSFRP